MEEIDPELGTRLDRIRTLTDEYVLVQDASDTAKALAARILREVDATRDALKISRP